MVAQKTLKSSQNYPYLISPIDETTEKHVFLPQKGPYLPNRPNRKTLLLGAIVLIGMKYEL